MSEPPSGTYRLQLRAGFGFAEAAGAAGYLAGLGVSHVYLSPILQAAPGSAHGYDVVDHTRISSELGGEDAFRAMAAALRAAGLKVIVDIVPNHMAIPEPWDLNRPLSAVLAEGRDSPYARWFDVDWEAGGGRIVLPFLGEPGEPGEETAEHYRLVYWREGPNYRRFFEISSLIGLRVEDPAVFAETHELILDLVRDGLIDGLRVDHPDGLAEPRAYLQRLAKESGGAWTVVEKILTGPEELPRDWPCAGTTGYDALGMVGGVFIDPAGEQPLTETYVALTGGPADFDTLACDAKREAAEHGLRPEVARLHRVLCRALPSCDTGELETVLVELLVAMPVYRTYAGESGALRRAADQARERLSGSLHPALDAVVGCTGLSAEFATRFQQTSAPLMAKGVEDTAFYRWSRLAALNEVGGEPARFAVHPADFHTYCARLARDWPATMTTLSTHDTKRQEDVRARLAVLAELPEEWAEVVGLWRQRLRRLFAEKSLPDPDLEYLIWQTLAGAWPLTEDRLQEYVTKAMREAKTRTSWIDPDPEYERSVAACIHAIAGDTPITATLQDFLSRLRPYARVNTLGQKLLQLAMPGVPDVYQGCELVGLSLVDPDNRRPVDYDLRSDRLARLDEGAAPADLDDEKLLVTSRVLRLRRDHPGWFAGSYEPLQAAGPAAWHVVAFRRGEAIAVATRLPAGLERQGGWADTTLQLKEGPWRDALTGVPHQGPDLPLSTLLGPLPVALLIPEVT